MPARSIGPSFMLGTLRLGPCARAALVACAALLPVLPVELAPGARHVAVALAGRPTFAPAALAQASDEIAPTPITTRSFERLLRAYVRPTDEESGALDRLHEAYLAKFRAELEPEIDAIANSMAGQFPTREQFDRFLRDIDRLGARIAEADAAFLASASALVAEERRSGFDRIREARERERALMGITRVRFGFGAQFVDLADLLLRCEPLEDRRADFAEFLRTVEQRTLAQARAHASGIKGGFGSFWDAVQPLMELERGREGATEPPNPEELERIQRVYMDAMAKLAESSRRTVRANFEGNRGALAQLGNYFDEATALDIRQEAVRRALTDSFGPSIGIGRRIDVEFAGERIARDASVPAEVRARVAEIAIAWRRDHVARLESWASVAVTRDVAEMAMIADGIEEGDDGGEEAAREGMRVAASRALDAIASELGPELAERFLDREDPADGGPVRHFVKRKADAAAAAGGDDEAGDDDGGGGLAAPSAPPAWAVPGFASSGMVPPALDGRAATRIAALLGVGGVDGAVVDAIVESHRNDDWRPVMEPISARIARAQQSLHSAGEDGRLVTDMAKLAEIRAAREEAARRLLDLDAQLVAEVAGVLGVGADHPFALLMRLERLVALGSRPGGGQSALLAPPAVVLEVAELDPAVARTVAEAAAPELRRLADEMPALLLASLARAQRMAEAETGFASRDSQTIEASSRRYTETIAECQRADADLLARVGRILEDAALLSGGEELKSRIRRARLGAVYPDVYRIDHGLGRQFAAIGRMGGLSPDVVGTVEAIRAEYDAIYDKLSEQMIAPAFDNIAGDGSPEAWRDYGRRMEAIEKVRFQRTEFIEKTRNALVRTLGPEAAAKVPGLVRATRGVEERRASLKPDDPNAW
jgi:hypothetical protein